MRQTAVMVLLALATALAVPALGAPHKTISLESVPHFSTLAEAEKSCQRDPVVWANLRTRVYHRAGSRWFGKTKHGAYFCQASLDRKGVRQARE